MTRGNKTVSSDFIVTSSLNSYCSEQEEGDENRDRHELLTLELSRAGLLEFTLKARQGGHPITHFYLVRPQSILNSSVGHETAKTRADIWVHVSSSITLNLVEYLSLHICYLMGLSATTGIL